jgi:hypothetical protein
MFIYVIIVICMSLFIILMNRYHADNEAVSLKAMKDANQILLKVINNTCLLITINLFLPWITLYFYH